MKIGFEVGTDEKMNSKYEQSNTVNNEFSIEYDLLTFII